jgi:hypothetical protein
VPEHIEVVDLLTRVATERVMKHLNKADEGNVDREDSSHSLAWSRLGQGQASVAKL